jgi:hypothetical protein
LDNAKSQVAGLITKPAKKKKIRVIVGSRGINHINSTNFSMSHPSFSSFLSSYHLYTDSLGNFGIINFMGFAHHLMVKIIVFNPWTWRLKIANWPI